MCVLQQNNQHAELWRYNVGVMPTGPVETFRAHGRCISQVFASAFVEVLMPSWFTFDGWYDSMTALDSTDGHKTWESTKWAYQYQQKGDHMWIVIFTVIL